MTDRSLEVLWIARVFPVVAQWEVECNLRSYDDWISEACNRLEAGQRERRDSLGGPTLCLLWHVISFVYYFLHLFIPSLNSSTNIPCVLDTAPCLRDKMIKKRPSFFTPLQSCWGDRQVNEKTQKHNCVKNVMTGCAQTENEGVPNPRGLPGRGSTRAKTWSISERDLNEQKVEKDGLQSKRTDGCTQAQRWECRSQLRKPKMLNVTRT